MTAALFDGLALADVHASLVRNIVSLRISQDLFDDLSSDPQHQRSAIALERTTKPAPFVSAQPVIDRPFEEARWNDAIGYPFKHWMQSRYSDGTFGVWYGADTLETSVHETVHHWRAGLLRDAGYNQAGIVIQRKVYDVRCDAALVDLRQKLASYPALIASDDYTLTHQVGAKLHHEGHPGLLARSARWPSGEIAAILNPGVLTGPQLSCFLTYRTTASGVDVERTPGAVLFSLN